MTSDKLDRQAQPWALGIGIAGAAMLLTATAAAGYKRRGATSAGRTITPKPGDEAEAGTAQTGEGLCPLCDGRGSINGRQCQNCLGTGTIIVNVGDA